MIPQHRMDDIAGVRVRFRKGGEETWVFDSYMAALFYIHMIPFQQVQGDPEALQIASAKLVPMLAGVN